MNTTALLRRAGIAAVLFAAPAAAQAVPDAHYTLTREIYRELVETNTAEPNGTTQVAEYLAGRLREAGFPDEDVRVVGPDEKHGNLIARLRGRGAGRPVLMLAHLDVVDARPEDWSTDPFVLTEQDGWFYGRGSVDNKAGAAILVANLIRLHREGLRPAHDLIVLLTSGEETDFAYGVEYVFKNHRPLVDAELALNTDAGTSILRDGRPLILGVQASEKTYLSFRLTATDSGGHSSVPRAGNPIERVAAALTRLAQHRFPIHPSEITRGYFLSSSRLDSGVVAQEKRAVGTGAADSATLERLAARDPWYNALLRTTCVATQLEGGHAENALPQRAAAVVNCRILPEEDPAAVERALREVIADTQVTLEQIAPPVVGPASPLRPDVMQAIERTTAELFGSALVMPEMSAGATDGVIVRNQGVPTYGVSALFLPEGEERAHGRDERVGVASFRNAIEFWYRLMRRMGG